VIEKPSAPKIKAARSSAWRKLSCPFADCTATCMANSGLPCGAAPAPSPAGAAGLLRGPGDLAHSVEVTHACSLSLIRRPAPFAYGGSARAFLLCSWKLGESTDRALILGGSYRSDSINHAVGLREHASRLGKAGPQMQDARMQFTLAERLTACPARRVKTELRSIAAVSVLVSVVSVRWRP
jgi:hypothetical protein